MRLSAGVVILADGTLLRDVTITINDGVINDIAPGVDKDASYYAVVTPMFHNGHSHTEYQLLSGVLPSGPFFPWVRELVRLKFCIPTRLWAVSTLYGVTKLLEMGYSSTEDCSDSGYAAATMAACALRGTSYREVNGLDPNLDVARCQSRIDELQAVGCQWPIGVAPHAVYSTCQGVLNVVLNRAEGLPLCIHVDESPEEDLFCRNNIGHFAEMYKRRVIEHYSPGTSALQHFDRQGLVTPKTLLVHGCNWTSDDVAIVQARGSRVAVCPESNQFLQCKQPPLELMYRCQIPIVIGTDSALSCPSMSPIHQLRLLMKNTADTDLHRWFFRAQVTPESGQSYDIQVGNEADFCAFGQRKSVTGISLLETLEQISSVSPDVFRSGNRMKYRLEPSHQADLLNVVQELATC